MSLTAILFIALAMSTDAFAAAIAKGAKMLKPNLWLALKTGLLFGIIEACTPMLGWLLGKAAVSWMESWDHWVAFALLSALGLHMIREGIKPAEHSDDSEPAQTPFWTLAVTAFATSIDAMAVGVGLAFVQVNILLAAAAIGLATFTMVTIGIMVGRAVGALAGKKAEILGGVILITVGAHILYTHLSTHG